MHLRDRGLTIVFNGELYNYRELRLELEQDGLRFVTQGDTEVLLHRFQRYGLDMLPRLRGMYAFAIWDQQAKTLTLARDPFGIKPLYYCTAEGVIFFASQVKSLQPMLTSDTPDPAGRAGFFLWGSVPEPYTLFKDIRSIPAGCAVVLSAGAPPRVHQAASVGQLLSKAALLPIPDNAAERQAILRDALLDSLQAHMTADVPVALFLSAGLDSATMAALLSETMRPTAVTLGFRGGDVEDETGQAAEIAAWYGLEHRQRHFGAEDFAGMYDALLHAMDQPTIDGINTFMISRMARDCGYKVALSGVGGDELFAGYPSFQQVPRIVSNFQWASSIPLLGRAARRLSAPLLGRVTSPKFAGLLEYGGTTQGAYLLRRGLFMPWELKTIMDPAMARDGLEELDDAPLAGLEIPELADGSVDRLGVHILEMSMYMRHQLLRDADWAGMANSVEVRVPLADWKLLTTLAPFLARGCFSKQDMAATPRRPLPDHIRNRPKTGFAVPVRDWISGGIAGPRPQRGLRSWALHLARVFSHEAQPSTIGI